MFECFGLHFDKTLPMLAHRTVTTYVNTQFLNTITLIKCQKIATFVHNKLLPDKIAV